MAIGHIYMLTVVLEKKVNQKEKRIRKKVKFSQLIVSVLLPLIPVLEDRSIIHFNAPSKTPRPNPKIKSSKVGFNSPSFKISTTTHYPETRYFTTCQGSPDLT